MKEEIVSKTYCPLPFNHIYIHPTNKASVCCAFRRDDEKGNLPYIQEYDKLSDHLNHPFIKDIQQKMLKGEKVPGCATCYYAEKHGYQSMREKEIYTWHKESFRDFTPPDLENPKLEFIEVTFGNYCNLACRTCNSDLSHSWLKENKMLGDKYLPNASTTTRMNIDREWQDDDFKDLQYLKITGGEPLLHPDFPKFMERLEQQNIYCFIFTNASWVPKKRIFDMMKNFKYLQVFLSVDGTGTVQEYMRHNSVWETTEKSVRKWMQWSTTVDNVQISWAPTWSLMNANYYIETCNWWLGLTEELLRDTSGESWNLVKTNFIFGPNYYQMSLLSNKEELKQKAKDYIEELKNSDVIGIDHIIEMTEAYIKFFDKDAGNEDHKLKTYYKMTETLDESRNQSLKKMIPLTYESMYNRKEGE
ncbi:MAG: twitch domain-containing radical SAM protein [Candidatus Endolissoclinum sp.]|nr:twitch domain-containing radical SAM protein [Candidatus Endolissoclinum sp.]